MEEDSVLKKKGSAPKTTAGRARRRPNRDVRKAPVRPVAALATSAVPAKKVVGLLPSRSASQTCQA
jgi:hypothetical protein